MTYYTIKDIEKIAERNNKKIISVQQEGKWVAIILDNGIRIKIRNY